MEKFFFTGRKCPDPGIPKDGRRNLKGKAFWMNSVVLFRCFAGFERIGSRTRTCLPSRRWSGALTICNPTNPSELRTLKLLDHI